MITYKEDDSFFTMLVYPGMLHRLSIIKWFEENNHAKFRFVRDQESESEYFNLTQVNDIYPGIKTIAVVMNPWLRVKYSYDMICKLKDENRQIPATTFNFDLENFESFVSNIDTAQKNNYWFTPATQQTEWLTNVDQQADYILRAEHMDEDFKIIQDYFCSNQPLTRQDTIPQYKEFYTARTRRIVAKLFKNDIERFGYKF